MNDQQPEAEAERQFCLACGQGIFVMIYKNTGYCSEICKDSM